MTTRAAAAIAAANTESVLVEVAAERRRQDAKWGEQNHPDGTGGEPERRNATPEHVERLRAIRREHADAARALCNRMVAAGQVTYRHILREEVEEAIAEDDKVKLRAELVQVAAVAVQWIEKLDREACATCGEPPPRQGTHACREGGAR